MSLRSHQSVLHEPPECPDWCTSIERWSPSSNYRRHDRRTGSTHVISSEVYEVDKSKNVN